MMAVSFSDEMLALLRASVKERIDPARFEHTLGVEECATWLGDIFLPDRVSELRAAAILHDATKGLGIWEHLDLIEGCDKINKHQGCPEQALHSFSGAALVLRDYPEFATDDVFYAIMYHTLGDPSMNLFAEIIFLSDYIERGRTYCDCVEVREVLKDSLAKANSNDDRLVCLHRAVIDTIDRTMRSVRDRGFVVDKRTVKTKKAISALI